MLSFSSNVVLFPASSVIDAAGVDFTVFVQVEHNPGEIEWVWQLSQANPFIRGIVGWLDITSSDV